MTMHPDNHAPHPCRRFDDLEITMPPRPIKRSATTLPVKPRERRPSALRLAVWALRDGAVFVVSLAVLLFAGLILFGTDAQINAWGLWARSIIGG